MSTSVRRQRRDPRTTASISHSPSSSCSKSGKFCAVWDSNAKKDTTRPQASECESNGNVTLRHASVTFRSTDVLPFLGTGTNF